MIKPLILAAMLVPAVAFAGDLVGGPVRNNAQVISCLEAGGNGLWHACEFASKAEFIALRDRVAQLEALIDGIVPVCGGSPPTRLPCRIMGADDQKGNAR